MLRDYKYKSWQNRIVCPVCNAFISMKEWEDYGMHLHCTEYYLSGRHLTEVQKWKNENIHLIKSMIHEI